MAYRSRSDNQGFACFFVCPVWSRPVLSSTWAALFSAGAWGDEVRIDDGFAAGPRPPPLA